MCVCVRVFTFEMYALARASSFSERKPVLHDPVEIKNPRLYIRVLLYMDMLM